MILQQDRIVLINFFLEEWGIKPVALQFWKQQDPLNLQQQALCFWSWKESNKKTSLQTKKNQTTKKTQNKPQTNVSINLGLFTSF